MKKYVYLFDETKATKDTIILLGNKGAQLAEMTSIGLPVPPGFTITTEGCNEYYENDKKWPEGLMDQVKEKLKAIEEKMGKKFGDPENPLLFSVRSGSYVSMPGMMDTVLNLGLNDTVVTGLVAKSDCERGAWDSYRRFLQMFGDVVLEVEHSKFEAAIQNLKDTKGVEFDTDLDADDLKKLVETYKGIIKETTGKEFPQDPEKQLELSINAVFESWNTDRAVAYRRINHLRNDAGTGVNVQVMVFGNFGDDCGTGVGFTRNPSTGEKEHYGEYLINAQGEDVVAGIRTPQPIDTLNQVMPKAYEELVKIYDILEKHYKDMQDFEFTIENRKLFMLQTRAGKRTAMAAVRIAVEMVDEGLIDKKTALMRVKPEQLDQLLHKQLDDVAKEEAKGKGKFIAKGLPASPGAAVGTVVFNAEEAAKQAQAGKKVILVRTETSPEDIEGMDAAQGILTARGGMTSHAAVVARGMGKACVAGCSDITVEEDKKQFKCQDLIVKEGDFLTLDGSTGDVIEGQIAVVDPKLSGNFATLMEWADEVRTLGVRTNAETPRDSKKAIEFGAEGIGLCRTEHMFFEGDRITAMREMIVAKDVEGRKKALAKILPFQTNDFAELFKVMTGKPVTVRLLDPPLHEFLPHEDDEIREIAKGIGITFEELKTKVKELHEFNPMLGHRGCRLGITYPEISEMQARAIMEAACKVKKEEIDVRPEIMIPLVGHVQELKNQKEVVVDTVEKVLKEQNIEIKYLVGTMIEVPRGALTADKVAKEAEFFSFGTNDLTQMGCGFSRDDAGTFLKEYVAKGIYERDPFQVLDQEGVGELVRIAVEKGKSTNPKLKIGICGEHGGEPASIDFCHRTGLDYVSCSPFRVPIARLAAAQAALRNK